MTRPQDASLRNSYICLVIKLQNSNYGFHMARLDIMRFLRLRIISFQRSPITQRTSKLTRYSHRGDRSSEARLSTPIAHSSQTFSRPKNPTPSGVCERADNVVAREGIHNVSFLYSENLSSKSILRRLTLVERHSSSAPSGERKQDGQEMDLAHCVRLTPMRLGRKADNAET